MKKALLGVVSVLFIAAACSSSNSPATADGGAAETGGIADAGGGNDTGTATDEDTGAPGDDASTPTDAHQSSDSPPPPPDDSGGPSFDDAGPCTPAGGDCRGHRCCYPTVCNQLYKTCSN
jgi:hypothetical protein